jgi:hypothetical protein
MVSPYGIIFSNRTFPDIFPIAEGESKEIHLGNRITYFVAIYLYDETLSLYEPVINIYVFDFIDLKHTTSTSQGTFICSLMNGAIVYTDETGYSYLENPPSYYNEGCYFIPQIVQHTYPMDFSSISGFSGGSHSISSRNVKSQILDDQDFYNLTWYGYGPYWPAWRDFLVDNTKLKRFRDTEDILFYDDPACPTTKLILYHLIIEMYIE